MSEISFSIPHPGLWTRRYSHTVCLRPGSNLRPLECQPDALPANHDSGKLFVRRGQAVFWLAKTRIQNIFFFFRTRFRSALSKNSLQRSLNALEIAKIWKFYPLLGRLSWRKPGIITRNRSTAGPSSLRLLGRVPYLGVWLERRRIVSLTERIFLPFEELKDHRRKILILLPNLTAPRSYHQYFPWSCVGKKVTAYFKYLKWISAYMSVICLRVFWNNVILSHYLYFKCRDYIIPCAALTDTLFMFS